MDRVEKEIEERKEMFEQELVDIEKRLKFDRRRLGDIPGKEEGRDGERDEEDGAEDKVTNDNANAADRDEEEDEAEKEAANGFMSNRRVVEMDDPSLVTTKSQV